MYRVVIADDEVLIRMYIREILENNGYEDTRWILLSSRKLLHKKIHEC